MTIRQEAMLDLACRQLAIVCREGCNENGGCAFREMPTRSCEGTPCDEMSAEKWREMLAEETRGETA